MSARPDKTPYDGERFLYHIESTARNLGAGFSESVTRQVLRVFDDEWQSRVIQLKATDVEGSALHYRYYSNGSVAAIQRAWDAGLIVKDRSPTMALAEEADATFNHAGCDFNAKTGLTKTWAFTGDRVPTERILQMKAMPQSARTHAGFFERHGLSSVFFVASDFDKRSMNIYFGWKPRNRTPNWIREFARDVDGASPTDDVIRDVLASLAVTAVVATTFSWDRPDLSRWSLYSLGVPYGGQNPGQRRLPPLPPRIARVHFEAPSLNFEPHINIAWSYGKAGRYMKIEKSYARDEAHFEATEWGGNFSASGTHGAQDI